MVARKQCFAHGTLAVAMAMAQLPYCSVVFCTTVLYVYACACSSCTSLLGRTCDAMCCLTSMGFAWISRPCYRTLAADTVPATADLLNTRSPLLYCTRLTDRHTEGPAARSENR
jgi:hypothetical protein